MRFMVCTVVNGIRRCTELRDTTLQAAIDEATEMVDGSLGGIAWVKDQGGEFVAVVTEDANGIALYTPAVATYKET